jgi:hypothetical protein
VDFVGSSRQLLNGPIELAIPTNHQFRAIVLIVDGRSQLCDEPIDPAGSREDGQFPHSANTGG